MSSDLYVLVAIGWLAVGLFGGIVLAGESGADRDEVAAWIAFWPLMFPGMLLRGMPKLFGRLFLSDAPAAPAGDPGADPEKEFAAVGELLAPFETWTLERAWSSPPHPEKEGRRYVATVSRYAPEAFGQSRGVHATALDAVRAAIHDANHPRRTA